MMKRKTIIFSLLLLALGCATLTGCGVTPEQPTQTAAISVDDLASAELRAGIHDLLWDAETDAEYRSLYASNFEHSVAMAKYERENGIKRQNLVWNPDKNEYYNSCDMTWNAKAQRYEDVELQTDYVDPIPCSYETVAIPPNIQTVMDTYNAAVEEAYLSLSEEEKMNLAAQSCWGFQLIPEPMQILYDSVPENFADWVNLAIRESTLQTQAQSVLYPYLHFSCGLEGANTYRDALRDGFARAQASVTPDITAEEVAALQEELGALILPSLEAVDQLDLFDYGENDPALLLANVKLMMPS